MKAVKDYFSKKANDMRNALTSVSNSSFVKGNIPSPQVQNQRLSSSFRQSIQPTVRKAQIAKDVLGGMGRDIVAGFKDIPNSARLLNENPNDFYNYSQKSFENAPKWTRPLSDYGIQMATNIARGVSGYQNATDKSKPRFDRILGGVQTAGAPFMLTPTMSLVNYGQSSLAGQVKGRRTGENVGLTEGAGRDMLLSEGLGIENPALALGVDVLGGGYTDPTSYKSLRNLPKYAQGFVDEKQLKNIEKTIPRIREYIELMDDHDVRQMTNLIDAVRIKRVGRQKVTPRDMIGIETSARELAERMGLNPDVDNRNLIKTFETILNARSKRTPRMVLGRDSMGFVGDKPSKINDTVTNPEPIKGFDKDLGGVFKEGVEQPKSKPASSNPLLNNVREGWNQIFNPLKNASNNTQNIARNWDNKVNEAKIIATKVLDQHPRLANIDPQEGWKLIQYAQNPTSATAKKLGLDVDKNAGLIKEIRDYYSNILQEARTRGLDVGELQNYINQVWKESPERIEVIAKGLGKTPQFMKERRIPTYAEGLEIGLTPKFTNPAQLMAHYRYQLERAIANREMVTNLENVGELLPRQAVMDQGLQNWKIVDAPFFPHPKDDVYMAPAKTANALNQLLGDMRGNAIFSGTAKTARVMQDIALSGGVPRTHLNAFTLDNVFKEVTSGRIKSPLQALLSTNNAKWLKDNSETIQMMAKNRAGIMQPESYENAYKNLFDETWNGSTIKKTLGSSWNVIKNVWAKSVNDPTFKGFIPRLQVSFFKDVYEQGLKSGLDSASAQREAAKATRAFYGLSETLSRPKDTENIITTLFMAPKYRESMINFWVNNLKAFSPKNLGDKAYSQNRKFMGGLLMTAITYELLNKQLTGHWMHENKEGKKISLEIPRENGRSWYIPILPSVSTLPRNAVESTIALLSGDVATAGQKASTMLSPLASTAGSLMTNQTFYNAPIYKEDDNAGEKFKKLGGYALEQNSPLGIGEYIAYKQGRKTASEALMGALELPVYPSRSTDQAHLTGSQYAKYKRLGNTDGFNNTSSADSQKQYSDVAKLKKDIEKEKATNQLVGNSYVYMSENGKAKELDLSPYIANSNDPIEMARTDRDRWKKALDIYRDTEIPTSDKPSLYKKLKIDSEDLSYYDIASDTEDIRRIVVDKVTQSTQTKEGIMRGLLKLTRTVNGKKILTSGIIDDLYNEGLISYMEKNYLKNIDFTGKSPKLKTQRTGAGRKAKMPEYKSSVNVSSYNPSISPITYRISPPVNPFKTSSSIQGLDSTLEQLRNPKVSRA